MSHHKGFTILELLVIIGIMGIMSAFFIPNYRQGGRQLALDRAAHELTRELRRAQEMAMSAKEHPVTGLVPPGYGIHFDRISGGGNYDIYLYADTNGSGNERYTAGEELEKINKDDEGIYLEREVKIKDVVTGLSSSPDKTSINFSPPDPITKVQNGVGDNYQVVTITLALKADETKTKVIMVNIVGLIDAE